MLSGKGPSQAPGSLGARTTGSTWLDKGGNKGTAKKDTGEQMKTWL
jgi:hypothetical protein